MEDIDDIRIVRPTGFRGITLPIMVTLRGTTAQAGANFTTPFFIANRNYSIFEVVERHEVAGSDGGAVTLQIEKLGNGTAPGAGVESLTTALSLKTTANTVQYGTIVKTSGQYLEKGEALTLKTSGTLTDLVGVTVHILLKAT